MFWGSATDLETKLPLVYRPMGSRTAESRAVKALRYGTLVYDLDPKAIYFTAPDSESCMEAVEVHSASRARRDVYVENHCAAS